MGVSNIPFLGKEGDSQLLKRFLGAEDKKGLRIKVVFVFF